MSHGLRRDRRDAADAYEAKPGPGPALDRLVKVVAAHFGRFPKALKSAIPSPMSETACPQCAAGVCCAHQPEPTPAELATAYPWALRVARYDEHGQLPNIESEDTPWPLPRSAWAVGPWTTEPDLIEWRSTAAAPYPLLILRGGMGQLNGYVGLPPGHPLHGKHRFPGASWSSACGGLRVPTGEPPVCWWLGFDCGSGSEYCPLMEAGMNWMGELTGHTPPRARHPRHYVTVEECRTRTEALAIVLKAVDTPEALARVFESRGIPLPD